MAKLKQIVKELSEEDFSSIHKSLTESSAEKSAFLLESLRKNSYSDNKIMELLEVNSNAYYTLRSRLNQKIEEYLLQQMESPRADILKKVANIQDVFFTKRRAISIATLKKLEKELIDYDLSNELTVIYKMLKRLHINSPDYFTYSRLYNEHVAYMLSAEKTEDMLANYFKKFGSFALTADATERLGLSLLWGQIYDFSQQYQSHRLHVYHVFASIFHQLFILEDGEESITGEPIENMLSGIGAYFEEYKKDPAYFHLELINSYLNLVYYHHYKLYRKAEEYFNDVDEKIDVLLSNFDLYTYVPFFLNIKMERAIRLGNEDSLYKENQLIFGDYESNVHDLPSHLTYVCYRALSCHFAGKPEEAARWLNNLLNEVSLKHYPFAALEVKTLLALQYAIVNEVDLFQQLISSIQRQIRIMGKESCMDIVLFLKILKTGMSEAKRDKENKLRTFIDQFRAIPQPRLFTAIKFVKLDHHFIKSLLS